MARKASPQTEQSQLPPVDSRQTDGGFNLATAVRCDFRLGVHRADGRTKSWSQLKEGLSMVIYIWKRKGWRKYKVRQF